MDLFSNTEAQSTQRIQIRIAKTGSPGYSQHALSVAAGRHRYRLAKIPSASLRLGVEKTARQANMLHERSEAASKQIIHHEGTKSRRILHVDNCQNPLCALWLCGLFTLLRISLLPTSDFSVSSVPFVVKSKPLALALCNTGVCEALPPHSRDWQYEMRSGSFDAEMPRKMRRREAWKLWQLRYAALPPSCFPPALNPHPLRGCCAACGLAKGICRGKAVKNLFESHASAWSRLRVGNMPCHAMALLERNTRLAGVAGRRRYFALSDMLLHYKDRRGLAANGSGCNEVLMASTIGN